MKNFWEQSHDAKIAAHLRNVIFTCCLPQNKYLSNGKHGLFENYETSNMKYS